MLSIGVDRVVDQVVNPKIEKDFKPQIDKIICEHLGLDYEQWVEKQSESNYYFTIAIRSDSIFRFNWARSNYWIKSQCLLILLMQCKKHFIMESILVIVTFVGHYYLLWESGVNGWNYNCKQLFSQVIIKDLCNVVLVFIPCSIRAFDTIESVAMPLTVASHYTQHKVTTINRQIACRAFHAYYNNL